MSAPELSADEKATVARMGIHDTDDDDDDSARRVLVFQLDRGLSDAGLKEALREYRSETGYSPWEFDEVGVLDVDFTNWFRWERL